MKLKWKIITIGLLMLGMIVVLNMVRHLVFERQQRAQEVRQEISQFSAGEQTVKGPFLVLPLTETTSKLVEQTTPQGKISAWEDSTSSRNIIISPEQFSAKGQLAVESLKRGIFEAPIYRSDLILSGRFAVAPLNSYEQHPGSSREKISSRWGKPYLVLSLSDVRGIQNMGGTLAADTLNFEPGTAQSAIGASTAHTAEDSTAAVAAPASGLGNGVHAMVTLPDNAQSLDFKLNLKLSGTTQLLIEPVGKESHVALAGNWPHPSFSGNFAPIERSVTAQGFSARWQTSQLATGGAQTSKCSSSECSSASLGLRLVDPVDRYVLNERTIKYAELFVLVIFGAVFLMALMRRIEIHPVQYALVGAALALFFLLTLSLSEHLGFAKAYWSAAAASVLLLGYYVSFVLAAWQRGVGFAVVLTALYGLLYGILQSEDMALLMGSITLFALLSCVMVLTRKMDWQALRPASAETSA
ncbi:cell envelope integrity protein CreD [Iodobacter sp. HSC-16F04]|uniref:Cell envelope integrity protein CreD n=1 Tax=Iodobacter violaceini TaxID=3044271 RepID=A0ABX0KW03_9NEIS|nr:cell envelope integrity protein CreD [Iodobacter violacea]NHQ87969.1 cell envelope integrity protein CreD [Iodobacter violacea]